MIADDEGRLAPPDDQGRQLACDSPSRDRGVHHGRQALLGDIVHHAEDAKSPVIGELVMDEVDRPSGVRHGQGDQRRPCAGGSLPSSSTSYGKPFLSVEPLRALPVDHVALSPEKHVQTAIAEPSSLGGEGPQPLAQLRVIRPTASVADHGPIHSRDGTRPPLAHLMDPQVASPEVVEFQVEAEVVIEVRG